MCLRRRHRLQCGGEPGTCRATGARTHAAVCSLQASAPVFGDVRQACPLSLQAGEVQGQLQGGGRTWTPAVFARLQADSVRSFYEQNGHVGCAYPVPLPHTGQPAVHAAPMRYTIPLERGCIYVLSFLLHCAHFLLLSHRVAVCQVRTASACRLGRSITDQLPCTRRC